MAQQKLVIIASCLIVCFLCACKNTNSEEKITSSAMDSTHKISSDSESVVNDNDTFKAAKTDTFAYSSSQKFNSVSEVNRLLTKNSSYFVIKTNRDTVIKCKEGTLLSIPADAFIDVSNKKPIHGEVKISVKEFYKISDIMIAGLATTSNHQLLETGGMINIKVTSKVSNDSCILKPGKNITIALVNSETSNVEGMQLFNGVHDSTSINWLPQPGIAGLAQSWRFRRNNYYLSLLPLNANFVFPDGVPKVKPHLINSNHESLLADIELPLRELMQRVGLVTKKAIGYIDTAGSLHCYLMENNRQQLLFNEIYSPMTHKNMKVSLAVDVNLSYKSNLNRDYFQKLLKMGRGNPDSLIMVTATLNPVVKNTDYEKIKKINKNVLTIKEYQKKQQYNRTLISQYEKRLKQLRLDDENKLIQAESNGTTDIQSAQNYLLLSTPKLGWINCDKFYNYPTKVDYFVKLKDQASLIIVFNAIKSIISADANGIFQSVPLNEKITIVGLKTENGKLMMAVHETTITEKPFEGLSFNPVNIKDYKNKLEKLNRL